MYAAGLGAVWIVLCVMVAAGLYLAKRVWIMLTCHDDWADAGVRMKTKYRRRYGTHRKPAVAPVPPRVIERANRVLEPVDTRPQTSVHHAETVTFERSERQ